MPQNSFHQAVYAALGIVAVAVLGLLGVGVQSLVLAWTGKLPYKQQTIDGRAAADAKRIETLNAENTSLRETEKDLRAEITNIWAAMQKLQRASFEQQQQIGQLTEQVGEIPKLQAIIIQQKSDIDHKTAEIADLHIMLDTALSGQERAEGALAQAQRTIREKVPCAPIDTEKETRHEV